MPSTNRTCSYDSNSSLNRRIVMNPNSQPQAWCSSTDGCVAIEFFFALPGPLAITGQQYVLGAKSGASYFDNYNLQVWTTKSTSSGAVKLTAQVRLTDGNLVTLQVPEPIGQDYRNRWLHVLLFRSIGSPSGWVLMFGRTGQGFGIPDDEADEFGTSLENTQYKYAVSSNVYLGAFRGLANDDDPAGSQHLVIHDGASYGPFPGYLGRSTNGVVSELRFWRLPPYPSGLSSYFPAAELRNQFVTGAEYPALLNCWRLNGLGLPDSTSVNLIDESWQDAGALRQAQQTSTNGTAYIWGYPEHPIPPDAIGEIWEGDTGRATIAGAAAELPLDADKPLAVEDADAAALVTADLSSTDILSADLSPPSSGASAVLDNLRNYLLPDAGGAGEADSFQLARIIGSLVLQDGAGAGNALASLGSRIDMGQIAPDGESDAAALMAAIFTYELPSADAGSSATADLTGAFTGLSAEQSDAGSGALGVALTAVRSVQPAATDRIVGQSFRNLLYIVREVVSAANSAIGESEAVALGTNTQKTLQTAPGTGGSGAALEIPLESARNYLVEPTGGDAAATVEFFSSTRLLPGVTDRSVGQSARNKFYMVREVVSAANGAIGEGEIVALDTNTQKTLQIAPETGGSGAALEIPLESARNYLVEPTGGDAAATVEFFNSVRLIPNATNRSVGESVRNTLYMVREVVSATNGAIGESESVALGTNTQKTLQIAPGTSGSGAALEIPLESVRNYLVEPTGGDAAATVEFFNGARLVPVATNSSSANSEASFDYIAGFDCGLIPGSGGADVFELSAINELRTGVTGGAGLAEVYEIGHIVNMLIPESDSLGGASGSYLLRDLGFGCLPTERSASFGTRLVLGSAFFVIPDSGESYTLAYAELYAVLPLEGDYLLPEAGAVAALGLSLALYPDPLLLPESGTLELPSSVARYFEFGPVGGRLEHNFVQENWVHYLIPEDTGGSGEAYFIPGLHRDVTYVPLPGDTGGSLIGDDLILTVNTEQFLIPEQGNPAGGGAIEYWEIPRFFYARGTDSKSRILEYGVVRTVQPSEPIYANCVSDEVG